MEGGGGGGGGTTVFLGTSRFPRGTKHLQWGMNIPVPFLHGYHLI